MTLNSIALNTQWYCKASCQHNGIFIISTVHFALYPGNVGGEKWPAIDCLCIKAISIIFLYDCKVHVACPCGIIHG